MNVRSPSLAVFRHVGRPLQRANAFSALLLVACSGTSFACAPRPPSYAFQDSIPDRGALDSATSVAERTPGEGNHGATNDAPAPRQADVETGARTSSSSPSSRTPRILSDERLSNGIRVLILENHELPIATFSILLENGDDGATWGLTSFYGLASAASPSRKYSSSDLHAQYGYAGARPLVVRHEDGIAFRMQLHSRMLSENVSPIPYLASTVTTPVFSDTAMTFARESLTHRLDAALHKPSAVLIRRLVSLIHGPTHPYAFPEVDREQLASVDQKALDTFVREQVTADRISVVASGDIAVDDFMARLEAALGKIPVHGVGPVERRPIPPPSSVDSVGSRRVEVIDDPDTSQSHVGVGFLGPAADAPSKPAIRVIQAILSRGTRGRLMVATRGAHGLTYGTHARTDALARSGTLTISSAVDAERTGTAVKAILDELDRLRTTPVDDEELAIARAHAIVDAYEQEGGSRTLHGSLEEVALARRPATEFADLPRRIAAVGPKEIKAAAERWLRVDRAAIVVVGNARVVTPQLRELGLLDPIP